MRAWKWWKWIGAVVVLSASGCGDQITFRFPAGTMHVAPPGAAIVIEVNGESHNVQMLQTLEPMDMTVTVEGRPEVERMDAPAPAEDEGVLRPAASRI